MRSWTLKVARRLLAKGMKWRRRFPVAACLLMIHILIGQELHRTLTWISSARTISAAY